MQRTVGLLLADASTLFRLGVREVVDGAEEFDVSEAANVDELHELLAAGPTPHLALVDLELPASGAMEAVQLLRRNNVTAIVWAKRSRLSAENVYDLVHAGAMGVLTKEISPTGLLRALRGATNGEAALGREVAWLLIKGMQSAGAADAVARRFTALSSRELQVLELVADGRANKEIAAQLSLSEFTVKRHIQNVLRKIGVRSRWEASASYLSLLEQVPAPSPLVFPDEDEDADASTDA